MRKHHVFMQAVSKISDVIRLKSFYSIVVVLFIMTFAYADDVVLDLNDEIEPHHNNDTLVVSDEKKVTYSNYSNYGVMTIDSNGTLNVEKEFYNIAQNDNVNPLYLATFNIDGGKFNAYSMLASHGDFRNFGFVNITNNGVYNNDDSVFYSEKDTRVDYENTKPRTLIDHAVFNNLSSGTYKNLSDADTYIQNSARFVNAGMVLNDDFSYFKLDSASTLENTGLFENNNTLKIVNSFFENTGTFKNSGSVEINSGSLHNNYASASIASTGGTLTIDGNGDFYNENGDVDISGGTVDMNGLGNFVNSSTVDFSASSVLKIRNEVRDFSERRLSLSNSGTLRFIGSAKLDISDGIHTNTGEIDVCDDGVFSMTGGFFLNSAKMDFSDTSSFSISGGTFENVGEFNNNSNGVLELRGGVFKNCPTGSFRGRLSLLGGEFEQSSTSNFVNLGTSTIDSVIKFGVDITNLSGAINNESGIVDIGQNAKFKLVLAADFADDTMTSLDIYIISGYGVVNDKYGVVMSAVSLEWENGTSANSDFVWNTVFENGNLKAVINSYVPEAADAAFFAGAFAVFVSICRRKNRVFNSSSTKAQ